MSSWDRRLAAATRVDADSGRDAPKRRTDSVQLPEGIHPDDLDALEVLLRHASVVDDTFSSTLLVRTIGNDDSAGPSFEITVAGDRSGVDVSVDRPESESGPDQLTGLPGRAHVISEIDRALARGGSGHSIGVFTIDLDRFKAVNDSQGFEAGDQLIEILTTALETTLRPQDSLARVGGDEFTIICPEVFGPAEAMVMGERFRVVCSDAPTSSPLSHLTMSIGIALSGESSSGGSLMSESETALYNAKGMGRDRCELFDDDLRSRAERRISVDQRLRQALDDNAIEVHYQPIVDLQSTQIIGAEALLRIVGEDGKHLNPRELVSAAEDSGLIRRIEETVMRHAVSTIESLPNADSDPLFMSFNISDRRLTDTRFPLSLARTLHNARASAEQIHLEIHPVALSGSGSAARLMTQLRALGVTVVIDELSSALQGDFVNPNSVDSIKLDQRLIKDIHTDRGHTRAKVVIDGITERGIDVCAVGIETSDDLRVVTELGCRYGQGYFFSPPVSRLDLAALVSRQMAVETTD